MLGRSPKDFDIATDAKPSRLKKMFRNCRIIGRRFRLAHLHYPNDKIIEVATFRSTSSSEAIVREGELIRRDNVFGTPEEDARRRDLTINALFYNIADFTVVDYVGGVDDLRSGTVRTIGDPVQSFREDPVRMLRAIRHVTRLGFRFEEDTRRALLAEREEILKANSARLLEELFKDLSSGTARKFFESLHSYEFLDILVPELVRTFHVGNGKTLFLDCLGRLDELNRQKNSVQNSVALAAFLSPFILPVARKVEQSGVPAGATPYEPFQEVLAPLLKQLKIYRRVEERLWHVLGAWPRLKKAFERGSTPHALTQRHYFHDSLKVFWLLQEGSPELDRFVEEARASAGPESRNQDRDRRPRRRRRRRSPTRPTEGQRYQHQNGASRRRRQQSSAKRRKKR